MNENQNKPEGYIHISSSENEVDIEGNKEGLLTLAKKIIEVAESDIGSYHKHIDEIEVPNLRLYPNDLELIIGVKIKKKKT